eukprot:4657536-Pleurochrysis_carterae.AAC.1
MTWAKRTNARHLLSFCGPGDRAEENCQLKVLNKRGCKRESRVDVRSAARRKETTCARYGGSRLR